MPKPAPIAVRLAAQALVLQGFANDYIGAKLSIKPQTVQKWRERNGWNAHADQAKADAVAQREIVQAATVQIVKDSDETVSKASENARKRTAKAILDTLDKLPIPESWSQGAKQQAQLEPLVRNCKAVFGWGEQQAESLVRISLMDSLHLVSDKDEVRRLKDEVIDVQSTTKHSLIDVPGTVEGGQPLSGGACDVEYMI